MIKYGIEMTEEVIWSQESKVIFVWKSNSAGSYQNFPETFSDVFSRETY